MKYEIDFDKQELISIVRQYLRDKYSLETLDLSYKHYPDYEKHVPIRFNVIVDGVTYEDVDVSVTIKK